MGITELHWSLQANFPILASLQLLPLLIMVLIYFMTESRRLFAVSVIAAIAELALVIQLYSLYQPHENTMQLAEQLTLFMPFQYHVAVDGVSVIFMLLTAVLCLMMVLYSYVIPLENRPRFLKLLFLIEATLMAQFATVDMFYFLLAATLQLIVVGYLLWHWATSPDRDLAFTRYLQFMGTGLLLLFIGITMLGWNYSDMNGYWSFDLLDLVDTSIAPAIQSIIFFLLFYGLAIRIPLFPLHGWLPLAAEHGMVVIAPVLLLGLKVGVYGLVRFVFPLLPEAVVQWHEFVVAFAVAGIFYAALLALMQVNLRRLLAFAVVSHTSILVIGLFSLNHEAFQGGLMLAVNFGLATTGLLLITGFVFWRTRTMLISKLGGLFDQLPLFGIAFFIAGLSIIGMPGTPGFDSVHLVLEASIHRFGALLTVAAAVGNVIAAGFLLWAFQKAFMSPATSGLSNASVAKASTQERLLTYMVIVILLGVGFYSEPWMDLIENSLLGLDQLYGSMGH